MTILLKKPYALIPSGSTLWVKIDQEFRSKCWAAWGGELQDVLKNTIYKGNPIGKIGIDFTNCIFADPLPIGVLLLWLKRQTGNTLKVVIRLPNPNTHNLESKAFLKFLCNEGFSALFVQTGITYAGIGPRLNNLKIEELSRLSVPLRFQNSKLLPARFLYTKTVELEKYVDGCLYEMHSKLIEFVPAHLYDEFASRLKTVLYELLDNVRRHAYPKTDKEGLAFIYCRYREGLKIAAGAGDRPNLEKAVTEECNHHPKLAYEYLRERDAAIEVFVADIGYGLTSTYYNSEGNQSDVTIPNWQFHKAFIATVIDGKRKNDPNRLEHASTGGLKLLGELLSDQKDFLYGRDSNSWIGSYLPFDFSLQGQIHQQCDVDKGSGVPIEGLNWLVRLSWLNGSNFIDDGLFYWNGVLSQNPVWQRLADTDDFTTDNSFCFFEDARFPSLSYNSREYKNQKYVIILPALRVTSRGIVNRLHSFVKSKQSLPSTIIIADIAFFDINNYLRALVGARLNDEITSCFEKIILITQKYGVAVLQRKQIGYYSTYENNTHAAEEYSTAKAVIPPDPTQSLANLVSQLRVHDSNLLWELLGNQDKSIPLYYHGPITWEGGSGRDLQIDGYLDFATMLAIPTIYKLVLWSLDRIAGITGIDKPKFISMDSLTTRLCSDVLNQNPTIKQCTPILVGSIFVTGHTEKEATSFTTGNASAFCVYFFNHGGSKFSGKNKVFHLFLWPSLEFLISNFPRHANKHERIAHTSFIGPGGTKSFSLFRFDKDVSLYVRTPKQTYKDLQASSPRLIWLSHNSHDNHHDLFYFNLVGWISASLKARGTIGRYLLNKVFFSLGGTCREQLASGAQDYFDLFTKADTKDNSQVIAIVYISEPIADGIISLLRSYLTDSLLCKIIPIQIIRGSHEGPSLLPSPLSCALITDLLTKANSSCRQILYFDTAVVSGHTLQQIKALLRSLGAEQVRSFTLLDRQRTITTKHQMDEDEHNAFWRIDVPRLGTSRSCQLCNALVAINSFREKISSQFVITRIQDWLNTWSAVNAQSHLPQSAVRATKILLKDPNKRLDIRPPNSGEKEYQQKGGPSELITIENSIGLSIYCIELHTMAGKNDLALKYSYKEDIPNISKIEILATQLLLFDYQNTHEIKCMMIERLLQLLAETKETTNYTALAALSLLLQPPAIVSLVIDRIYIKNESQWLRQCLSNSVCLDILILLSFWKSSGINGPATLWQRLERFFLAPSSLKEKYSQLHRELFNYQGIMHSRPLSRLCAAQAIPNYESDLSLFKLDLSQAIDSLMHTHSLVLSIEPHHLRVEQGRNQELVDNMLSTIDNSISSLNSIHKSVIGTTSITSSTFIKSCQTIASAIQEELRSYHSRLFLSIEKFDSENLKGTPLHEQLRSLISGPVKREINSNEATMDNLNEEPKIEVIPRSVPPDDGLPYKQWFIWNNSIIEEITYFISNVKHASGILPHPFVGSAGGNCHMWVWVEYTRECVKIITENLSSLPAKEVSRKCSVRKRWTQTAIAQLGVQIHYSDKANIIPGCDPILITTILIPYLGGIL